MTRDVAKSGWLVEVLNAFAKGCGGNIPTITRAKSETMAGAARDPKKRDRPNTVAVTGEATQGFSGPHGLTKLM